MGVPGRIDGDRLLARLDALARVSEQGAGVTRLAYSAQDAIGRELVAGWMSDAGLEVTTDPATNVIGRLPRRGSCPRTLVTGSHLDTVVQAGRLDGAYGVVAAIEVAVGAAALHHPLTVVAFANEEGARGTAGLNGSTAIAGRSETVDLGRLDDEAISLADRLRASGGEPEQLDRAAWPIGSTVAFVELHVEQGPLLDRSGRPIGVVQGITGQRQLVVDVVGCANHAGTTPMSGRHDALVAAAELVSSVEHLTGRGGVRVATVGHMTVEPNVRNVVPGRVRLTVDLRDVEGTLLDAATTEFEHRAEQIGVSRGVSITASCIDDIAPTSCHPVVRDAITAAAEHSGLAWQPIISGASHDAQSMAALGPVGMIFVPSADGVSHAPSEATSPDDLVAGANVLLDTLVQLDEGPLCDHTLRPRD